MFWAIIGPFNATSVNIKQAINDLCCRMHVADTDQSVIIVPEVAELDAYP